MSKRVRHELTYPDATVEQVAEMLRTSAFREAVADHQRVLRREVTISDGDPTVVRVELTHGTDKVPSFARKIVGDEVSIHQEETWASNTVADVVVTIPGKPGDMTGTATVEQRGDDVVETYDLEIQVKLPLVGGKVEALIGDLLVKAFKAEERVGVKWLAGEWRSS